MNLRERAAQQGVVEVGSPEQKRIQEIEHLSLNLDRFLRGRNPENPEETVSLLYNTFCELDEQFNGGVCTIEDKEDQVKLDITKFVGFLPKKFGEAKGDYRKELFVKLCYGAMKISLQEVKRGRAEATTVFGTYGATSEITEVFLGNKVYKSEITEV